MSRRRTVATWTTAVLAAATLASCADSQRDGEGDSGGGGDDGTFVFGAAGAPEMFDPYYATDGETFRVTRQMFEGLLGIEPGSAGGRPGAGHRVDAERGRHRVDLHAARRRDLPRR